MSNDKNMVFRLLMNFPYTNRRNYFKSNFRKTDLIGSIKQIKRIDAQKNAIFLVFVPVFFIYTRFGLCGFPHFETQNWHSQ